MPVATLKRLFGSTMCNGIAPVVLHPRVVLFIRTWRERLESERDGHAEDITPSLKRMAFYHETDGKRTVSKGEIKPIGWDSIFD